MRSMMGAIWSLKKKAMIDGEFMTLFDARDRGLIEVNKDPLFDYYSYRVINTGEVVSFYRYMNPRDWSDWYREALVKKDAQFADTHTPNKEQTQ